MHIGYSSLFVTCSCFINSNIFTIIIKSPVIGSSSQFSFRHFLDDFTPVSSVVLHHLPPPSRIVIKGKKHGSVPENGQRRTQIPPMSLTPTPPYPVSSSRQTCAGRRCWERRPEEGRKGDGGGGIGILTVYSAPHPIFSLCPARWRSGGGHRENSTISNRSHGAKIWCSLSDRRAALCAHGAGALLWRLNRCRQTLENPTSSLARASGCSASPA